MSKQWGGKRANSGRHKVTQKVKHLRPPVLEPRNSLEELAMNWFRGLKPEQRLITILDSYLIMENGNVPVKQTTV